MRVCKETFEGYNPYVGIIRVRFRGYVLSTDGHLLPTAPLCVCKDKVWCGKFKEDSPKKS